MEKLIKDVDERSWLELKGEAAYHRLRVGEFLSYLVKEHKRSERKKKKAWDYVLRGKKSLSKAEAATMRETLSSSAFEREYTFEG